MPRVALARWMLFVAAFVAACGARADEALWTLLKKGGQVVMIRHATTEPGTGDPPGFQIDDCSTQRNLSDDGRKEALRIGEAFIRRGVPVARVLSSRWCRCLETASIAFGGAEPSDALGNLYTHPERRDEQLAAFRKIVANPLRRGNLVLVTHGETIQNFVGVRPAPGVIVVATPRGAGELQVAGSMAP
jgi:phosphohistidine phosphatase SixA